LFEENPKLKEKGPRCDQCFPGVHMGNVNAWEVFQRYSSPFGADSGAILSLCDAFGIEDKIGTLEKVLDLIGMIDSSN
jgi:hypothetical protein